MNPLAETWKIHNNINLYLLESINQEYLPDKSSSKGRTVGEQFSHINSVRMMWLKVIDAELLEGLSEIENPDSNKAALIENLQKSGLVISELFEKSLPESKIRGFKPHATGFLGYLISHESHHRGQIMLSLKQSGHPVDKKIQYGLWEWGTR